MNDTRKAELAMLIRVAIFGQNHPLVPASAKATEYYATVNAAKDVVLASDVTWDEGRGAFRAATAGRHAVIGDLRASLREISLTAKALNRAGVLPGIQEHFRMPGQTMQELRTRAGAFAAKAAEAEVKPAFIAHDCAATFVEDLNASIEAFDDATDDRFAGLGRQVGATAQIRATLRAGVTAVRALNSILIKRYRNDAALLAEWKAAQQIAGWPSQPSAPAETPGGSTGDGGSTPPPTGS
jgi:hypothetical protein